MNVAVSTSCDITGLIRALQNHILLGADFCEETVLESEFFNFRQQK